MAKKSTKYFGDVKDVVLSPKDSVKLKVATIGIHMSKDQFMTRFFPAMVDLFAACRRGKMKTVMFTGHRASGRCRRNRVTILAK